VEIPRKSAIFRGSPATSPWENLKIHDFFIHDIISWPPGESRGGPAIIVMEVPRLHRGFTSHSEQDYVSSEPAFSRPRNYPLEAENIGGHPQVGLKLEQVLEKTQA
jgi:hypothetical protein